jgi:two-component system, OmpR family, response regulator MtrA
MARIFVADDNADVRHVVMYSLMDLGHDVALFRDGEAVLEALLAEPPDVLILDIMMPGYDGYEVLEQLKSWGVQDGPRTLVLSARAADEDRVRALALGADVWVSKPFDPEELADAVRALVALSDEQLGRWRGRETRDVVHLLREPAGGDALVARVVEHERSKGGG